MAKKEKEVKENKKNKNFLKEMRMELKKVTWPTPKELLNNTVAVIAFVLIIAVIVFALDFCFDNLNKHVITKFQEKVQSSFNDENTENNDESNDSDNLNEEESNENSELVNDEENKTEATEIQSQETETEKNESQE